MRKTVTLKTKKIGDNMKTDLTEIQYEVGSRLNLLRIVSNGGSEPSSSTIREFIIHQALPNILNCTTD
jgi:hypothetical protein